MKSYDLQFFIPGTPFPKQSVRTKIMTRGAINGKCPFCNGQGITNTGRALKAVQSHFFVSHYKDKKVQASEKKVSLFVKNQLPKGMALPWEGPVRITSIQFTFPPLKSFNKSTMEGLEENQFVPKTTRPDLTDNLQKGLIDAMTGIIWVDDSQIYETASVYKCYGIHPGTTVKVQLIDPFSE